MTLGRAESSIGRGRIGRLDAHLPATRTAAAGRSTRQHVRDAVTDAGVERRVDDWHRPSVDEHQQRDHLARHQLDAGRHRTAVVTADVEDDVRQVPRSGEDDEQAENGHHHLDDLLMTLRRRHAADGHLRPQQRRQRQ